MNEHVRSAQRHCVTFVCFVAASSMWPGTVYAADDYQAVARVTQEYASCVAQQADKTARADATVAAATHVQRAIAQCAALREQLKLLLEPVEREGYLRDIDRGVGTGATRVAERAQLDAP